MLQVSGSACISLAQIAFQLNDDEDFAMFVMFHERRSILTLNYLLLVVLGCLVSVSNQCVENSECKNGYCRAGMCICNPGWWGSLCQFCRLRWARNRIFRSSSWTQLLHINYLLLEIARYQKLLSLLIWMLLSLIQSDSYIKLCRIFFASIKSMLLYINGILFSVFKFYA